MTTATVRRQRRQRLLDAMGRDDLDVLVLARPADVSFATGARQLWTAGTRPFGPMCVVVRATGRAHVLSVFDEGMPPEIGHDDLYGLSWNPTNLVASLARIDGLADARRVGTASSSPGIPSLLRAIAREADVVDGAPAVWSARTPKTPDEVAYIGAATRIAEAGLTAMIETLRPGISERDLLGAYLERIASLGAPTPPSEGVIGGRSAGSRTLTDGELVPLDAGAFSMGYEGGIGRTWVCGASRASSERCRRGLDAVIAACRPGATGADLKHAWTATGEPLPGAPLVHGIGLGVELPIIGGGVGDSAVLAAAMVLSVCGWASDGVFERDLVLVGDGPPEVLSRYAT